MEDRMTLKKKIALNIRAYKLIDRIAPGIMIGSVLVAFFATTVKYLGIWFGARIIDAIATGRTGSYLTRLVLISLCSIMAVSILLALAKKWHKVKLYIVSMNLTRSYSEKFLEMDYVDTDDAEVRKLLSVIRGNEQWMGWGLIRALGGFQSVMPGIFSLLGAAILTFSFFTSPVTSGSGFVSSPWFLLVFIILMTLVDWLALSARNRSLKEEVEMADDITENNRFSFYLGLCTHEKAWLDARMYDIIDVADEYSLMSSSKMIAPGGAFDRFLKLKSGPLQGLSQMCVGLLQGLSYLFVALRAWFGAFSLGAVTQYVGSITALFTALNDMIVNITVLDKNTAFLEKVFEFIDIPNRMYKGSLTTEKREDRQYSVEFKDVSFKYPGSDDYALRHVNMKFKVGARLAVVGENGSGKSTFIKLLSRLYDPTEGVILLNGIDIRKYRYEDYIALFSVVFQDFKLISTTIGKNIAGSDEYDERKVLAALRDAGLEERLESMPDGLDTILYKDISEKGVEVSGGEAQKIAIARALYKDAPFIILDEPTAALDPIAEAEIYAKFNEISGDRTSIYISHRLSSCKFCDEIAVFDNGGIVEKGSHEELLKRNGKYRELWDAQAQYYQDDRKE